MTKNRSMRIAVLVLALALITCCFVGTTFAKYTSSATGSDTVTVAKWSFKVNGSEIVADTNSSPFNLGDIDLFATILDEDGSTEEDVADNLIAPGTSGSFSVKVQNTSEVSVLYTVEFTESQTEDTADIPIVYSKTADGEYGALADIDFSEEIEVGDDAERTLTVYWKWAIGADAADNAVGIDAPTLTITANMTATQVQ